jgi:hypothetical protein
MPVRTYKYHASCSTDKRVHYNVQEKVVQMNRLVPSYLLHFARLQGDCIYKKDRTCTFLSVDNLDNFHPCVLDHYSSIQLYIEHRWEKSFVLVCMEKGPTCWTTSRISIRFDSNSFSSQQMPNILIVPTVCRYDPPALLLTLFQISDYEFSTMVDNLF